MYVRGQPIESVLTEFPKNFILGQFRVYALEVFSKVFWLISLLVNGTPQKWSYNFIQINFNFSLFFLMQWQDSV